MQSDISIKNRLIVLKLVEKNVLISVFVVKNRFNANSQFIIHSKHMVPEGVLGRGFTAFEALLKA